MKKALFALAIGAAFCVSAAELAMDPQTPWKKTAEGYSIDYSGSGWTSLSKKVFVEGGKFYRFSWEGRLDGSELPKIQIVFTANGKNSYSPILLTDAWAAQTAYYYAKESTELLVRIALDPGKGGKILVRNTAWDELTPEQLKANLLPNGDFENGVAGISHWLNLRETLSLPLRIVGGQNFLNGEKSLEMDLPAREKGVWGVKSRSLPIEAGKIYTFSFWAKASAPMGILGGVSIWAPTGHNGKHFNQIRSFKLETEWKEFSWDVTIPADAAEYPDVADCMAELVLMTWNADQTGKIWFDDISFRQK